MQNHYVSYDTLTRATNFLIFTSGLHSSMIKAVSRRSVKKELLLSDKGNGTTRVVRAFSRTKSEGDLKSGPWIWLCGEEWRSSALVSQRYGNFSAALSTSTTS